jgi:hypothetical protein
VNIASAALKPTQFYPNVMYSGRHNMAALKTNTITIHTAHPTLLHFTGIVANRKNGVRKSVL